MADTIYREDAIEAVRKIVPVETEIDATLLDKMDVIVELSELPSAENSNAKTQNSNQETQNSNGDLIYRAEDRPTVIRSISLMPTKDFKEWAKRVRETNPNAVVIPCDAEVVSAEAEQGWIPCSERLPDDLAEVNVTWVNHDPEPYYDFVKEKPASASAVFYKGKWFWYSSVCADILAEYGENDTDEVDNAIEILAWMPLPKPYREDGEV